MLKVEWCKERPRTARHWSGSNPRWGSACPQVNNTNTFSRWLLEFTMNTAGRVFGLTGIIGELRMSSDKTKCPECNGAGESSIVIVSYAPGMSGPPIRELECTTCEGVGWISSQQVEQYERGLTFRKYRVTTLGLGLREAASRWGMKAPELSYIEQGKVATDWTPPGYTN